MYITETKTLSSVCHSYVTRSLTMSWHESRPTTRSVRLSVSLTLLPCCWTGPTTASAPTLSVSYVLSWGVAELTSIAQGRITGQFWTFVWVKWLVRSPSQRLGTASHAVDNTSPIVYNVCIAQKYQHLLGWYVISIMWVINVILSSEDRTNDVVSKHAVSTN